MEPSFIDFETEQGGLGQAAPRNAQMMVMNQNPLEIVGIALNPPVAPAVALQEFISVPNRKLSHRMSLYPSAYPSRRQGAALAYKPPLEARDQASLALQVEALNETLPTHW